MSIAKVVGTRIRERRMDQGLRQADVAESVGISASYLNLIEHNKRRIGGKLLSTLADVLATDVATLSQGGDAETLDGMRAAAARAGTMTDVERAEDLAARFPDWARLIAAQEARIETLEIEVQSLSDRIAYDPALASALHNVISAVTSIRATAGILVSGDRVDADWQNRFHANIHDDSRKLAEESKALVSYLDQPKAAEKNEVTVSVFDQIEKFIARHPELLVAINSGETDDAEKLLRGFDKSELAPHALELLNRRVSQFVGDANALQYDRFVACVREIGIDPAALASEFDVPFEVVLRRLAHLPSEVGLAPMGLAVCDAAGSLVHLKALSGFGLHRRASSCPLWPLFAALVQPMSIHRRIVALPDPVETRFMCYATARIEAARNYQDTPEVESTMLVVADPVPGTSGEIPVGTNCRVCPRQACRARREPSVMMGLS